MGKFNKEVAVQKSKADFVSAQEQNSGKGMRGGKGTLSTDWIQHLARGPFDVYAHAMKFPGQKAVFFNPWTDHSSIDGFVEDLVASIAAIRAQRK